MKIGNKVLGNASLPYVIAEVGVNHENDLDLAKRMIREVAEAGGDAVKFQTYKAGRLASRYSPSYWDRTKEPSDSQFKLFTRYDKFDAAEYAALADVCREVGVDFMSTPFDLIAVEFLAPLVPAFKIASADLTNLPLLEAVAAHGKPVILSTGASRLEEVRHAVDFLDSHGAPEIALLHCVLSYPTAPQDANLRVIGTLKREFPKLLCGYSDHVPPDEGMLTLATAYGLGAQIIEKHYTYDKSLPGNDHYHAMDQRDLRIAVEQFGRMHVLLGSEDKVVLDAESNARKFARRSLVAARALRKGEILGRSDIAIKRPGTGISPIEIDAVIGRRVTRDIVEDEILQHSDLDGASRTVGIR